MATTAATTTTTTAAADVALLLDNDALLSHALPRYLDLILPAVLASAVPADGNPALRIALLESYLAAPACGLQLLGKVQRHANPLLLGSGGQQRRHHRAHEGGVGAGVVLRRW
jgi:hypothetical protein